MKANFVVFKLFLFLLTFKYSNQIRNHTNKEIVAFGNTDGPKKEEQNLTSVIEISKCEFFPFCEHLKIDKKEDILSTEIPQDIESNESVLNSSLYNTQSFVLINIEDSIQNNDTIHEMPEPSPFRDFRIFEEEKNQEQSSETANTDKIDSEIDNSSLKSLAKNRDIQVLSTIHTEEMVSKSAESTKEMHETTPDSPQHTTLRDLHIFDGHNFQKSAEKTRKSEELQKAFHVNLFNDVTKEETGDKSTETLDNSEEIQKTTDESSETVTTEQNDETPKQSPFRDIHLFETTKADHKFEHSEEFEKFTNYDDYTGRTGDNFESVEDFGPFVPFQETASDFMPKDIEKLTPTALTDGNIKRTQNNMLSTLVFPPLPRGELYKVQGLGLEDGFFLFSFISSVLSLIQPAGYPTALAKDALLQRISPMDLLYQSVSSDPAMVTLLTLGIMLAVIVPIALLIVVCMALARRCRGTSCDDDDCSDGGDDCGSCRRCGVVFAMQIILVLSVIGIAGVFIANEEISLGGAQTKAVARAALNDASLFVRNSHAQLHFVVSNSLDQAVDATIADLDNMDSLVGRPVQREIAAQTGVDVALDLLMDISLATQNMAEKCITLHQNAGSTRQLVRATQERLVELRLQVDALKRQCSGRDRPLCDTLDATGLEVSMDLDRLLGDLRLAHLRKMRNDTLASIVQSARSEFQFIPHQMDSSSRETRHGIRRELESQRIKIRDSLRTIDDLAIHVNSKLQHIQEKTLHMIEDSPDIDQYRWIVGLISGLALLMIWLLLFSAILCGCCGAENRASCTVVTALILVGLVTTAIWGIALASLVLGAHGEQLICRPLYEEPDFKSLTTLFDNPGGIYGAGKPGLFSNLGYKNDTLDVPLRNVLAECRDNAAAYKVFRLSRVFDAELAAEHRTWGALHTEISRLQVDLRQVQILTPDLQRQMNTLMDATNVNISAIRNQLSGHVTRKDVSTFARQLESVASQMRDSSTSSRLDSLVTRARRLLSNNIQPLEQRKEDLVYQLTAMEVQLSPLQKQMNSSLAHLKTIQYFINNQGSSIAQEKSRQFAARLLHYVDQFQNHVMDSLRNTVAPCRPVWNIFQASRIQACKYIIDPVNGLWLSLVWCLIFLLIIAIPTGLKLISYYGQINKSSLLNKTTGTSQESPPASNAWGSNSNNAESQENW